MKNKLILRITILSLILFSLCICSALTIYYSNGKYVQYVFDEISKRQLKNTVTLSDKLLLSFVYTGMIYGGNLIYPEASMILKEYLYGNKDTLELPDKYFKTSSFIQLKVNNFKKKIIGPVYLRLTDDKRIAYAINGFFIEVTEKPNGRHFRLYQDIIFNNDKAKRIATSFSIFGAKIIIPDRLVHIVKTRKSNHLFVFSEWEKNGN